jgi:thiamine pyrophosphate-dependent acetolactate synthase large subunit-like protein
MTVEIRNSKQEIRSTKKQTKTVPAAFGIADFAFRVCFGFRAWFKSRQVIACFELRICLMMTHHQALEVLARHRGNRIVVTTMGSVGIWPALSDSPLDFHYIPSAMGQGPALGLGLALAQPGRGVIVINGDGCMLMNLGSLVTIASHPAPLYLVIIDNGLYEVTGGQPRAGTGQVDFAGLARSAGIARVYPFDTLEGWQAGAPEALTGPGPVAIWLKVEGKYGQKTPTAPRPMSEQIKRLQQALGVTS